MKSKCSRKCVDPKATESSSRDPTAIQNPIEVLSAPGTDSLRIRRPLEWMVRETVASPLAWKEISGVWRSKSMAGDIASPHYPVDLHRCLVNDCGARPKPDPTVLR